MYKHMIFLSSAYSIGTRIALDYTAKERLPMDTIKKDFNYINKKLGEDSNFSTHYIQTEKPGWKEVQKYDGYFKNVKLVKTKEEFVDIILQDMDLTGLEVARYILAIIPCTHLKLEKLTYLCYADYLCNEKEKLFVDKIYAYRLGPVIKSVYEKYKKTSNVEDNKTKENETKLKLPIRSRIIASHSGIKKLMSINKTLDKYGNLSASELVDITHKKCSPWSNAGAGTLQDEEINDELILKFHKNEII